MKFRRGSVTVSLQFGSYFWDPCFCCQVSFPEHDYFDYGRFLSARFENNRQHITGTNRSLSQVVQTAKQRGDVVGVQPDPECQRIILFANAIHPGTADCRPRSAAMLLDATKVKDTVSWCTTIRLTQFCYLSKPEKSRPIVNGVVDALAHLSLQTAVTRWLIDLQPKSEEVFCNSLVENGFERLIEAEDSEPFLKLAEQIRRADVEGVRETIRRMSNLNTISANGMSPLMQATTAANPEIVRILLNAGASVECANPVGRTALSIAAQNGLPEVCEMLIEAGASLETRSSRGETPLMFAAWSGKLDTVRVLISRGANRGSRNKMNKTASDFASEARHAEIANFLRIA
jgi:hypothetical protein